MTEATDQETDPVQTVRAFFAALEELDITRALTHVAPEIVYQNVPLPPARGVPAFEKQLRRMARYSSGFEARINHIAADGGIVLTERTDVFQAGGWRASFWVCGTFEVRDGRIVLWRDYFDWTTLIAAGLRGVPGAVRSALTRRRAARKR